MSRGKKEIKIAASDHFIYTGTPAEVALYVSQQVRQVQRLLEPYIKEGNRGGVQQVLRDARFRLKRLHEFAELFVDALE